MLFVLVLYAYCTFLHLCPCSESTTGSLSMEQDGYVHLDQCNNTRSLQEHYSKLYPYANEEDIAVMVRNSRYFTVYIENIF